MRSKIIVALLFSNCLHAQFSGNDDFNDNNLNFQHWTALSSVGSGGINEANQQLEYTSNSGFSYQYLLWTNRASYDEDFDLIIRTANKTDADNAGEYASVGIEIYPAFSSSKWLNVRHGSYYVSGFGGSRDISANFYYYSGATLTASTQIQANNIYPQSAIIKLSFDSTEKVFRVFYDENPSDGTQWSLLSVFGVDENANGTNNLDFELGTGSTFQIYLYGIANDMGVESGQLVMDDFQASIDQASSLYTADAVTFSFETELGRSYRVTKSTDLSADPTFLPVDLQASSNLYRIVPSGDGDTHLTGNGNTISVIDTSSENNQAFYKIEAQ